MKIIYSPLYNELKKYSVVNPKDENLCYNKGSKTEVKEEAVCLCKDYAKNNNLYKSN